MGSVLDRPRKSATFSESSEASPNDLVRNGLNSPAHDTCRHPSHVAVGAVPPIGKAATRKGPTTYALPTTPAEPSLDSPERRGCS